MYSLASPCLAWNLLTKVGWLTGRSGVIQGAEKEIAVSKYASGLTLSHDDICHR